MLSAGNARIMLGCVALSNVKVGMLQNLVGVTTPRLTPSTRLTLDTTSNPIIENGTSRGGLPRSLSALINPIIGLSSDSMHLGFKSWN